MRKQLHSDLFGVQLFLLSAQQMILQLTLENYNAACYNKIKGCFIGSA